MNFRFLEKFSFFKSWLLDSIRRFQAIFNPYENALYIIVPESFQQEYNFLPSPRLLILASTVLKGIVVENIYYCRKR